MGKTYVMASPEMLTKLLGEWSKLPEGVRIKGLSYDGTRDQYCFTFESPHLFSEVPEGAALEQIVFEPHTSRVREFFAALRARLDAGAVEYGDRSFDRPLPELLAELQEEALDLGGWGFVIWARLESLRKKAEAVEQLSDVEEP